MPFITISTMGYEEKSDEIAAIEHRLRWKTFEILENLNWLLEGDLFPWNFSVS